MSATHYMNELRASIAQMQKPDRAEIRVGDLDGFRFAIERQIGPLRTDPKARPGNTFMGVPVIQDWKLPRDKAALIVNDEIKAIFNITTPEATRPDGERDD